SLFTLEIENGIQFGTVDVVKGEVQYLHFTRLGLELETKHRRGRGIGRRSIGKAQHAHKNLAVVHRLAQLDFDALVGKTDEIGNLPERPVYPGGADLESLVIDVLDLEYTGQLPGHLLAIFNSHTIRAVDRHAQESEWS